MPTTNTSSEVDPARGGMTAGVGRAARAGLEDPVLQACLGTFRFLAGDDAGLLEAFGRYVQRSLEVFLPPERAALVRRVFLSEAVPPADVEPLPHPAQRFYVLLTLREALLELGEEDRKRVAAELGGWPWVAELTAVVDRFLGDGGVEDGILTFAPWPCDAECIGIKELDEGRLRAIRFEGHWFARHTDTAPAPSLGGRGWPAGHSLWLKEGDRIEVGGRQLGVAECAFFLDTVGSGGEVHLHVTGRDVELRESSEGALARVRSAAGTVLEAGDSGVEVPPLTVNGEPASLPLPLLPGDQLEFGELDVPANKILRQVRDRRGRHHWSLRLEEVTLVFPDGTTGIDEVTLALQSGDLVGIMGPSGCGKSTLMSLLTGEHSPSCGKVTFTSSLGRRPSFALVPQDDIVFPELTVRENLRYAAALRGSAAAGADEERLEEVLRAIGLAGKSHLRVGSVVDKVLSGGQRKRLNIGLELTATPDGLLLDEPTSGLSSADATGIMRLLRARADENMLVMAVVHQPSQEVFDLFDKIIILDVGGRLAFFGSPREAIGFFRRHSVRVQDGPEGILETLGGRRTTLDGGAARRVYGPDFWKMRYEVSRREHEPAIVSGEEQQEGRQKVGATRRAAATLGLIARREFLRKLKEWRSFLASTSISVLLALIIGWVGRSAREGEAYSFADNANLPASLFLAVILVSFLALSASVQEMVKDNAFRIRERLLGVSPVFWLVGKLPWLVLSLAVQTLVVALCVFGLIGLELAWAPLWWVLTLTAWCSAALGLLVSSLPGMNERVALASVPLLLVPQLILCGAEPFAFSKVTHLHWPFEKPPEAEQAAPWPSRFMPSRWAYQAAVCTLREAPELENAFDERTLLKTYNLAKNNVETWGGDEAEFFRMLSERMEEPVDAGVLRARLDQLVRAGYRSAEEVEDALGDRTPKGMAREADLQPLMNSTFQYYAEKTFPEEQTFLGREWGAARGARLILVFMTGAFLLTGAVSLLLKRRLFGTP